MQMMRPGDQSLGAGPEEVINCRCALLYATESQGKESPCRVVISTTHPGQRLAPRGMSPNTPEMIMWSALACSTI